ncbi:MAG TPA: DinB family protein [Bryobacteraceae bacterium]|nr:DinB family protein [Bryobacteraceae bacterium]
MSDVNELLERFRRGPELLAVATTGAAGSELDFVPGPEKWSVRQIVCHLADAELEGAVRFRRVIAEENPALIAYDQEAWARHLGYSRRKLSQALESFRRIRSENHELLKALPEEAFSRTGTHNERGVLSLLDLLKIYTEHAEQHARQIREVRDAYKTHRTSNG